MEDELILADLGVAERRLERLEKDLKKARTAELERERDVLTAVPRGARGRTSVARARSPRRRSQAAARLSVPVRQAAAHRDQSRRDRSSPQEERPQPTSSKRPKRAGLTPFLSRAGTAAVAVCAKIELEIAQLDAADAAAFLADLGLKESGLDRVIRASYDLLGYISFFTVGEDECRAWSIPRGTPAQLAAGEIHSDIARGFIRAEVVGYDRADRRAARWPRAATTARSASKARSTSFRTATSSTSDSPHNDS